MPIKITGLPHLQEIIVDAYSEQLDLCKQLVQNYANAGFPFGKVDNNPEGLVLWILLICERIVNE